MMSVAENVKMSGAKIYAEVGSAECKTAREVAAVLPAGSTVYLFDRDHRASSTLFNQDSPATAAKLAKDFPEVVFRCFWSSMKRLDSYCWSLGKLLQERPPPQFEFIYLDGAHTWNVDGFAFLLLDRLLVNGGYIEFDDWNWCIAKSPSCAPKVCPQSALDYTEEQMQCCQVQMIQVILVNSDSRYSPVGEHRLYRKLA